MSLHTVPHLIVGRQYLLPVYRNPALDRPRRHHRHPMSLMFDRDQFRWYTEKVADRVHEQCRLFNHGVRSGDWSGYLAAFAPDATLRIDVDPDSPYAGRDAIAAAYAAAPPDDTITVRSVDSTGDTDVARFDWDAGGSGTLRLRWTGDRIAELAVELGT